MDIGMWTSKYNAFGIYLLLLFLKENFVDMPSSFRKIYQI